MTAGLASCVLALALRGAAVGAAPWAWAGFAAMAVPVVAAGAWLAREQGRSGALFLVAFGTGLVARAALLAAVVATAARSGGPALPASLVGLALGFAPVTIFELVWFARRARGTSLQAGGAR